MLRGAFFERLRESCLVASSCCCCEFQETSLEKYPLQSTYIPSFSEYHSEVSSDVLSFLYNPTISYVYLRHNVGYDFEEKYQKITYYMYIHFNTIKKEAIFM